MSYSVIIQKTKTGQCSMRHYDYEWENDYWWSDGNMACDCNRELEFERGLGNNSFHAEKCSNSRFKIIVISDKGEILYSEFNPHTGEQG